jgi:hypothetical protein
MRTSRASAVYPDYEGERSQESNTSMEHESYSCEQIAVIKPRLEFTPVSNKIEDSVLLWS